MDSKQRAMELGQWLQQYERGTFGSEFRARGVRMIRALMEEAARADAVPDYQSVVQAVARGWCNPATEKKVMDPVLAMAIANEVYKLFSELPPKDQA